MGVFEDLLTLDELAHGLQPWSPGSDEDLLVRLMVWTGTEQLLYSWYSYEGVSVDTVDIAVFNDIANSVYEAIYEEGVEEAKVAFKTEFAARSELQANGLRSGCKSMADWVITKAVSTFVSHSGVDTFLQYVKARFEELLGEFKDLVFMTFGWLKEVWDRFTSWAAEVLKDLCGMTYHVLDGVVVAVVIVGVTTILYATEKFLLAMGLMKTEMNLAKVFLTTVSVCISIKALKSMAGSGAASEAISVANKLICELIAFFPKWQWESFFPGDRGGPFRQEIALMNVANFAPVDMLTQMGAILKNTSTSTVVETGKFFAAIEQIKRGYGTLKEIGQAIFRFFCDLVAKILGRRSQFLQDATALIGHDVAGWVSACDALLRDAVTGRSPADVVLLGYKLISQGNKIKQGLQVNSIKLSNLYAQQIFRLSDQLSKVVASLDRSGDGGPRRCPFVVAFVGVSRTGKSELRQAFESHFLKENGFAAGDVYLKCRGDDFWTGYHHQCIASFDDLGASASGNGQQTDEVQFIDLVSSAPLPLNMAALEEKGTFFTSPLITYSSNFEVCSPSSGVKTPAAFNNRRNIVIKVVRDDSHPYDPTSLWKSQKLFVLNAENGKVLFEIQDQEGKTKHEVLFEYVQKAYDEHTEKEVARLQQLGNFKPKLGDQLRTIGSLLCAVNQFSSPLVGNIMAKHPEWYLLGVYKEHVWAITREESEENGEPKTIDITHLFSDKKAFQAVKVDGELMLTTMAIGRNNMKGLSEISRVYFEEMVMTSAITADLQVDSSVLMDPSLLEELEKSPRWFRVLVGSIHESYYARKKGKGLFTTVLDSVGEQLMKVYNADVADWPIGVKVLVGFTLVTLFGGGVMAMMGKLSQVMSNPSTAINTAMLVNSNGLQHKRSGAAEGSRITFRNRGVQPRYRYANAAGFFDDGFVGREDEVSSMMSKLLVEMKFPGRSYNCLQMPGHRLRMMRHYVEGLTSPVIVQLIYGDGRSMHHMFDPTRLKFGEGTEICEYEHPSLLAGRRNLYNLFEFDPQQACGETFPIVVAGFNSTRENTDDWAFVDKSIARVNSKIESLNCGTYIIKIPQSLAYTAVNYGGDCGALIMAKVGNQLKVVGLHAFGDRCQNSYACLLPYFAPPAEIDEEFVEPLKMANNLGPSLVHVGKLKDGCQLGLVSKSAFEATPVAWHFEEPIEKEPAILSKFDKRCEGKNFDPYETGILKYAAPASLLDQQLLEEAAQALFSNQKDVVGFVDDIMPLHDAINGFTDVDFCESLVLSTSEGFPHVLSRKPGEKGKFRFFEGEPGARSLVPDTTVAVAYQKLWDSLPTETPLLRCVENVKDEKLPLRKIYDKPKSRLFSVLPLEFNLVARQLFLPYMSMIMSHREFLPAQVGVNPYSREWHRIAEDLQSMNNSYLCCDYSGFDGLLTSQLMFVIAEGINGVIGGSQRNNAARLNMLMSLMSRVTVCGFKVYEVSAGLPSGFALTVIINSILNELLLRYYYLKITKNFPIYQHNFDRMIKVKIYGDDNLIAVHPHLERIFTGPVLKAEMAKDGITITDGTDKTLEVLEPHSISEVDFLQRKFVKNAKGLWTGPLNKKSLMSQLQYVKTKNQTLTEAYLESAENVLREMYLHSVGATNEWRRKFLSLGWIKPTDLPTIKSLEIFHSANQGCGPAEMADIEMLVSPELVGAFCEVVVDFPMQVLAPRINICSAKVYREMGKKELLPVDAFPIWIGCGSRLSKTGMTVSYDVAHGRGLLPTTQWFKDNVVRKGNVYKQMMTAYGGGKTLVFISPDQIVRAYVFAVFFLKASKLLNSLDANAALSIAIKHCSSLGYLVEEGGSMFV
nr:MAG: polyprotein [Comovirus sp.]